MVLGGTYPFLAAGRILLILTCLGPPELEVNYWIVMKTTRPELASLLRTLGLLCLSFELARGQCTCPSPPQDGFITTCTSTASEGTVLSYRCASGFRLIGDYSRTCQADNTWTGQQPYCNRLCNCPPEPDNGFIGRCYQIPGSQQTGDSHVVDYHCKVGYFLNGVSTRTCQRDGTWSDTAPVCLRSVCPCPAIPPNGSISGCTIEAAEGVVLTFNCDQGFFPVGATSSTCRANATWTTTPPVCTQFNNCVCPPAPPNGFTMGCNGTGNLVRYSCSSGYVLAGTGEYRTCTSSRTWTGRNPSCLVPPDTSNEFVLTHEVLAAIIVGSCVGILCIVTIVVVISLSVCLCKGRRKHQSHNLSSGNAESFNNNRHLGYPTLRYEVDSEAVSSPNAYPTLRYDQH